MTPSRRIVRLLSLVAMLLTTTSEAFAATPAVSAGFGQVVILRSDGTVLQTGSTGPYTPAPRPFVLPGITGTVGIAARWDGLAQG
jgi:hypothetical protein